MKQALLATAAAVLTISAAAWAQNTPTPAHQADTVVAAEVDGGSREAVTWDLTDLYADADAWQAAYDALEGDLAQIAEYRGRLGESAAVAADAYDLTSSLSKRAVQLFVYATLVADEDTRIQENLARRQLGQQLFSRFGEETAWMSPEVLAVGAETIEDFIADEPRLAVHAFSLRDALRQAPHTLSEEGERILSAASLPLGGPQAVYTQLSASDIPWPTIDIDGEDVRIDNQGYVLNRAHADRDVRRRVFDAFWGAWADYESSVGAALASNTQSQTFNASMRDYENARSAALFSNALPDGVYDQLLTQAREGLPVLHRYFALRAQMLGVDDLAYYDIYPELVTLDAEYPLDTSMEITLAALEPFGEEYIDILQTGFEADWMHAYPNEGKRSGAYVFGAAYDVHPYVLLNHQDTYSSLSTFAHEWGHAVHSVLANAEQPWETSGYATFVAEMASTINQVLLLNHLQENASNDDERLFFLGQELEMYRGTFFRQAMFGEYEAAIHAAVENGEALTGERFTEMYRGLLEDYHGHDAGVMAIDPAYAVEWAYIPHFYYNFYVFQYATSMTASTAFAQRLLSGEDGAQEAVIDMLKAGGSRYPHDMFVAAGVDLTTPEPYQAVFTRMTAIMDEMETLLEAANAE